jgi:hypothetical protein
MPRSNLPQQDTINQYIADGQTSIFNYTFLILIDEDIAVYVTTPGDEANPDKDLKVLNQDYTVQNAGTMTGGTISFVKGKVPVAGSIVTLVRSMQVGIETEFGNAQSFNGHTLDAAFERVLLIMQQFQTQLSTNTLQYIINSYVRSNLDNKLPVLTTQDNQVWVSQGGNIIAAQIENTDVSTLRSELASQAPNGGDGTSLVGYYDVTKKTGQTLQVFLNQLQSYIAYLNGFLPKPIPDGSTLGLPVYSGKSGLCFYDGDIGKIYAAMYPEPSFGELLCDGTRYLRSGYSQEGIPYGRVAKKLWDNALGYYRSGNGATFVTANLDAQNRMVLTTNQPNSANAAVAGTSGFTVDTVFFGNNYGFTAFLDENELGQPLRVTCQSTSIGSDEPPKAETSGFTITDLRNSKATKQVFQIDCIEAKNLAGKYFSYSKIGDYYIWFTVDGKGDDPKPKKKSMGFKLPLIGTQTAEEVALYLAEFFSSHQLTTIEFLPAKQIKPGSYWTFYTSTPETFHVMLGKADLEPSLDGTIIHVDRVETDTVEQVAQKTKIAINQFFFAVPDLRGAFIRGWDEPMQIDLGYRYFPYGQGLIRNHLGSFQLDETYAHSHPALFGGQYVFGYPHPSDGAYSGGDNSLNFSPTTGDRGGEESRPVNFSANFVIKY